VLKRHFYLVLLTVFSSPCFALQVGLSQIDITPAEGVSIAGYGGLERRILPFDVFNRHKLATYFRPAHGVKDALRAKALVLKDGEKHIVFLSIDAIAINQWMYQALLKKLEKFSLDESSLLISATHTHSGSGGLSIDPFWALLAADKFKQKIFNALAEKVYFVVAEAFENLRPAELFFAKTKITGTQKNRRNPADPFDPTAQIIYAKTISGEWLGALVNFAIHGTGLNADNFYFSADVPGSIERSLSQNLKKLNTALGFMDSNPPVLFTNGAQGDVAPLAAGILEIDELGKSFSGQVMKSFSALEKLEGKWSVKIEEVFLGRPQLNSMSCLKTATFISWLLRHSFRHFSRLFPRRAKIWNIKLGGLNIFTWPGEPTSSLGMELKRLAGKNTMIMALTNGHLSYFTNPKEYGENNYEACASFYGPDAGKKIISSQLKISSSH